MQIKIDDLYEAAKERTYLCFNGAHKDDHIQKAREQGMLGELAYLRMVPNASSIQVGKFDTGFDVIYKGARVDVKVHTQSKEAARYNNMSTFSVLRSKAWVDAGRADDEVLDDVFKGCDVKALFEIQAESNDYLVFKGYVFRHTPFNNIACKDNENGKFTYYINYKNSQLCRLK